MTIAIGIIALLITNVLTFFIARVYGLNQGIKMTHDFLLTKLKDGSFYSVHPFSRNKDENN